MDAELFWAVHTGLPREGVGSDATARRLLAAAGPLPPATVAVDVGCGPGRSSLVLAGAGLPVLAVDTHRPFLDRLRADVRAARPAGPVVPALASMAALPVAPSSVGLLWCEGAAYVMGVDAALRTWRPLLRPGGVLVLSDACWTDVPAGPEVQAFWAGAYPAMRPVAATTAAAERAGYEVLAAEVLPESDWTAYLGPMADRLAALAAAGVPAAALAPFRAEIDLRRAHPGEYGYAAWVLRRP
ncbi:class I SAM-dependent methyltransferase [Blastococcus sp. SYSU D00820]